MLRHAMANLFCFGIGYTAEHYVANWGIHLDRVAGTVRDGEKAARLTQSGLGATKVAAFAFDGVTGRGEIADQLAEADFLLVSIPPDAHGDPVLRLYGDALARAARLQAIVYLSTVGVYGDHDGGWVDETTAPMPVNQRSLARLDVERDWAALAAQAGKCLAILRLSGIYGPVRNALRQLASPAAKRILKPGQVFNRIHVADIADAIQASFARQADGIFNVTDDLPTPPGEPIAFAADLLGIAPPPEMPFEQAAKTMTAIALSFYGESKRVRNHKMKRELDLEPLRYPTYREGLRALFSAGDHQKTAPTTP
jgi:NAD-dependent epimerase/dehydratase family protein